MTSQFYTLKMVWSSGKVTYRTRLTWEEAMDQKEGLLTRVTECVECWMEEEE